jgi:hypothetical protein
MTGAGVYPAIGHRRLLCLVLLAIFAGGLVLLATREGVPTSTDDAAYLGAARSLDAGHGLDVPIRMYPLGSVDIGTPPLGSSSPTPTPLVIYAPLQPVLLAIGGHPVGTSRVEATLFLALSVFLVGLFVLLFTDDLWLAAAAQLIVAFSLGLTLITPATDGAALFFTLVALGSITRYRVRSRPAWLVLGSVAIGLATLQRFAAGGLIVWAVLALRKKPRAAVAALVMSCAPLAAWFVYEKVSGRSTGHYVGFHIVKTTIRAGIHSLAFWILPSSISIALAALGSLVVILLVLFVLLRRGSPVTPVFVLYAVVQIVILEVAITFFDAGVNLDPREFIPVYVAVVIALACGVGRSKAVKIAAAILVVACGVRFAVNADTLPPGGFLTPRWTQSPVVAAVRDLPAHAIIYSDAPDVLYLLDQRATSTVPETVDFSTLKVNPRFNAQIEEIRHTLSTRGGYVVYIRGLGRQSFVPSEASLRHLLSLKLVRNTRDGAIYTLGGS